MGSRAATHPSDEMLSLYALGKVNDQVAETIGKHLAKCADCRHRAAELSSMRSVEHRNATAHPADETLSFYSVGKVDDTVADTVGRHLAKCPDCRRRVVELSSGSSTGSAARKSQARPEKPSAVEERSENPSPTAPVTPAKRGQASLKGLPAGLANHPQYEVERELGRGAIGIVYLARNKLMDRLEVLKVLTREMLDREGTAQRFLQEIQSAARLSHPNVVAAHSAFQVGDVLVFAMEYVEGSDLAKLVRERGPLPVVNACYFAYQAAQGLQHAHERGMIHRDIKPSNLILYRQGKRAVVKILDFGLAKAASERSLQASLTHEGQMLGTPDYIAPEQTLDAQKADIRADLYSLGCTLYHLLAGHPPFRGSSLYEILQAHHSVEAVPLNQVRPEVPAELAAVVAKMMAKNPADRFQTPAEVVDALKPFLKIETPRAGTMVETDETIRTSLLSGLKNKTGTPSAGTVTYQSGMTQVETSPIGPNIGPSAVPERSASPAARVPRPRSAARSDSSAMMPSSGLTLPPKKRPILSKSAWMWTAVSVGAVLVGIGGAWLGGAFTTKAKDNTAKAEDRSAKPDKAAVVSAVPSKQVAAAAAIPNAGSETPPPTLPPVTRGSRRVPPGWRTSTTSSLPSESPQRASPFFNRNANLERDDNALLMKLIRVPRGQFLMGDKTGEDGQDPVPVRISKEFWIGKYEVTQLQWRQVMQSSPWSGQPNVKEGNDYPATYVDWQDATQFCEKLSEQERSAGRLMFNMQYVLPTEAQWEYACRGGTTTRFSFGDDEAELSNHAWFAKNASGAENYPHAVGQRPPNAFGLFDMHGNVAEWCRDVESRPLMGGLDPEVTSGGSGRMNRGGSIVDEAKDCRSGGRRALDPTHRDGALGFRVAMSSVSRSPSRPPSQLLLVSPQSGFPFRPGRSRPTFTSITTVRRHVVVAQVRDDNVLKLKLIRIAPGNFMMGAANASTARMARGRSVVRRTKTSQFRRRAPEMNHVPNDGSVDVTLTEEFWLGKDEVTQAQWHQLMRTAPWHGKSQVMEGENYPATFVNWTDAASFCKKLTEAEHQAGRLQAQWKFALPTEAQWEYACCAGTTSQFSFGDEEFKLPQHAWFGALQRGSATREAYAHEVGLKACNPWGLDDMHGNVCEWCRDRFKDKVPGGTDPEVTAGGTTHVIRGGAWDLPAAACTSGNRGFYVPSTRRNDLGFRVAIVSSGLSGGQTQETPQVAATQVSPSPPATAASPPDKTLKVATAPSDKKQSTATEGVSFAGSRAGQVRVDNGLKSMLVWIPPGTFTMGTDVGKDHHQNEGPAAVTLTNGFWLAKYEVTQAEWQQLMKTAPWHGEQFAKDGEDFPATYVQWEDATAFCVKLTKDERGAGRLAADWEYRLPTEAQWEYACRASTSTPYSFGKALSELPENAWFMKNAGGDHEEYAHRVGGKNANPWGLHDVHGNVAEWCRDWYTKDLPGGTDPEVLAGGSTRVLRGGGWRSSADDCRSTFRYGASPTTKSPAWGFRIAVVKSDK